MSVHEEYRAEQQRVDALLAEGYAIASTEENLDGMRVAFVKSDSEGDDDSTASTASVDVLILTADARKYVSYLVFAGGRSRP